MNTVYFFCGIPGSGKDFCATVGYMLPIISYDKIRIQLYKEKNTNWVELTPHELYSNAFNEQPSIEQLNSELLKQAKEYINQNEDFAICNTFVTRKARRRIINLLKNGIKKDLHFVCNYILLSTYKAIKQDLHRKKVDKSVGVNVINKMALNQQIPSKAFEPYFNEINFIY
jgi:predicted kinase